MIMNIYCYYNKLLEAFGNYQLDDHEPAKVVAGLTRDLRAQWLQKDVSNLKPIDLYVLGQFNDETGEFTNDKHLLMSLGDLIAQFEAQKVKDLAANESKQESVGA